MKRPSLSTLSHLRLLTQPPFQDFSAPLRDEESDQQRAKIFQEYANGGLEILQEQLRGSVNHGDQILLFLEKLRENQNPDFEEFDLTRFL